MSMLSFECRHRYAGGFQLDVCFELAHRVTSLFGPSGSGKTSVLSIIAGFLRPDRGKVRIAADVVLDTQRGLCLPPERRSVGIVFQDHLLFPHYTVKANLRYGKRYRRRRHRPVQLEQVAKVLEISGLLRQYPQQLSGGERQRVALGRALLSGPELLLMDEPLASLDAPLKERILTYLERVVEEWKIPTIFVTHSQAEVRRLADWVVVMENGRTMAAGPPNEALSRPQPLGWKNSLGPVNLLRLEQVEASDDHLNGRVGGQMLYLPPQEIPATSPLFVQFSPVDVTLSLHDVDGLSARNRLHGRVCQIVSLAGAVFVAIDIGQIFWAEMTPQAASELQLQLGSEVTCFLKAHSLRLVD